MKLVVTQPFADFKVGDSITDTDAVAATLESHPGSVVKTPDDPKPEPAPAVEQTAETLRLPTSRRS